MIDDGGGHGRPTLDVYNGNPRWGAATDGRPYLTTIGILALALAPLMFSVSACGADSNPATGQAGGGPQSLDDGAGVAGADASVGAGGSAATIAGTMLPLPASCAEFGIQIELGCEDCPVEPPHCDCLTLGSALLLPEESCVFGKCFAAYDCQRLCRNAPTVEAPEFQPEFVNAIEAMQDCRAGLVACTDDAECGGGQCLFHLTNGQGQCDTGDEYSTCLSEDDCTAGLRCVSSQCHQPGGLCNDDMDCTADGVCVVYGIDMGGLCSTGEAAEPCLTDAHCIAPYQCVEMASSLGQCFAGAVGDPCNADASCDSGVCFADGVEGYQSGTCSTGEAPAHCLSVDECLNERCSFWPGSPVGVCVEGTLGSRCLHDQDCESGLCGLNPMGGDGLCVAGEASDPCADDGDCLTLTCTNIGQMQSALCEEAGTPCEQEGICGAGGACFQGKCG